MFLTVRKSSKKQPLLRFRSLHNMKDACESDDQSVPRQRKSSEPALSSSPPSLFDASGDGRWQARKATSHLSMGRSLSYQTSAVRGPHLPSKETAGSLPFSSPSSARDDGDWRISEPALKRCENLQASRTSASTPPSGSEAVTDERKVPAAAKAARPSSAASSLSDTMSESDESFRPRSQTKRPTDGRRSEPTVDDGCSGDASLEDSTVDDVTLGVSMRRRAFV